MSGILYVYEIRVLILPSSSFNLDDTSDKKNRSDLSKHQKMTHLQENCYQVVSKSSHHPHPQEKQKNLSQMDW